MSTRHNYAVAILILLLAAGLRMTQLTTLPPGLGENEIINLRMADTVRQGEIKVFYTFDNDAREAFYPILLALSTSLTGSGTLGYRILSVWIGLLTLAMVYSLMRHVFDHVAALAAMGLLSVMMSSILLSRAISRDVFVPMLITTTLLAMVWALPIYRRTRRGSINTTTYSTLGAVLGISFYVHQISLLLVLASMIFLVYMLRFGRRMSRRRLSYIGFTILVMLIIGMPYLITSLRNPDLSAGLRLFGEYSAGLMRSIVDGLFGIITQGDSNPANNLPQRALIDPISGLVATFGFLLSILHWRQPRYALFLITAVVLAPAAFVVENSPNFAAFSSIIVPIALFFGIGISAIYKRLQPNRHTLVLIGLCVLLLGNLLWTTGDLFTKWGQRTDVNMVYSGDLGQLARYINRTAASIPTVLCDPAWQTRADSQEGLSRTERMLLMVHRQGIQLHDVDCNTSLLFMNAGEEQQILFPEQNARQSIHPLLLDWLELGSSVAGDIPDDSGLLLNVPQAIADTAGRFITTAPVAYAPEATDKIEPISPPIRFGGNITFLGYERLEDEPYHPGDVVNVVTYWRVEGMVPPQLRFFVHILSDPVTVAAQNNMMSINPRQLRERDVFIQIIPVTLSEQMLAGEYFISVIAQQSDERLSVLEGEETRGDRLFLYTITVEDEAEEATD